MRKTMRKLGATALSAVLLVGLLGGCSLTKYDPIQEVMGYPGSTVMFTVNGKNVTASDYFFWMAQNTDTISQYYTSTGSNMDWTADMGDGTTVDSYVKDQAQKTAVVYSIVTAKAAENGYTFTDEDQTKYDEQIQTAKQSLGGDDAYALWLKSMCLTDETMYQLSSTGVVYSHMQEGMCREGGQYAPTDGELTQYAADNDLLCAKHILLMTQDASGNALSDTDKAAKKAKAEELLKQLQAVTDPAQLESKFDALMQQNSEDTGLEQNPDGYVFTKDQMVAQFEETTRALQPGQLSGIVESNYGYHIILRLDPAASKALLTKWEDQKMDSVLQDWVSQADVQDAEHFTKLTTADFYDKLSKYRTALEAAQKKIASQQNQDANTNTNTDNQEPIQDDATGNDSIVEGGDGTQNGDAAQSGDSAQSGDAAQDGNTAQAAPQ